MLCESEGARADVDGHSLENRNLIGATTITTETTRDDHIASKTALSYGPIAEAMTLGRRQHEMHIDEVSRAGYENRESVPIPPAGKTVLTDNIRENWSDMLSG